jgi:GNAT superfamily N-acetyltransferase
VKASVTVSSEIPRSPRVLQVASMMDLEPEHKLTLSWDVNLPIEDRDWNVGLITGPSGSGKTTLASHLWPGSMGTCTWGDGALVDSFPDMPVKEILGSFSAVGLSSVPAWLRPYSTLSTGEKFRADMARLLAEDDEILVVDEFTSVVDRQVAKAASHALQKAVRRKKRKVVAVTCHYDVEDWLQPDWVLDVPVREFRWRQVQPHPQLTLEIRPVPRANWPLFAPHHYLSAVLPPGASCYGTFLGEEMVCFTGCIRRVHPSLKARQIWVCSRQVTLPDWQGLGIGTATGDWIAEHYVARGWRFRWLTSHPGLIAHFRKSRHWRQVHDGSAHQVRSGPKSMMRGHQASLRMLRVACFEYVKRG